MLSDKIKQRFAYQQLAHTPTPLERMSNLNKIYATTQGEINLWIKRDDCTGLAMGGNKARQLEFYLGEAAAQSADIVLTTGAVQSNHLRMAVAGAHKLGMQAEVQMEQRVPNQPREYYQSGNPFLIKIMGARLHKHPDSEDEEHADRALYTRANQLKAQGKSPYVIPLAMDHQPLGALGYVLAAQELLKQMGTKKLNAVVVATGSGTTHSGLLTGLRALGCAAKVYGICVRRTAGLQAPRIIKRCKQIGEMIGFPEIVSENDILIDDSILTPGYGQVNNATIKAIRSLGYNEGILLDPAYTGKAMAGLFKLLDRGVFQAGDNVVFLHTGGVPGVFGYPELSKLEPAVNDESN